MKEEREFIDQLRILAKRDKSKKELLNKIAASFEKAITERDYGFYQMGEVPYYREYVEKPDSPRPLEPCNHFEHPTRWARLSYWEKARADRAEEKLRSLVMVLFGAESKKELMDHLRKYSYSLEMER